MLLIIEDNTQELLKALLFSGTKYEVIASLAASTGRHPLMSKWFPKKITCGRNNCDFPESIRNDLASRKVDVNSLHDLI